MTKLRNNVSQDKIGETNAFSFFYEKQAMLVTMSHPPAYRSMFEQQKH